MKKIGILLAILLVAGVCAMADEAAPAAQGAVLFADVDAVALSQAEMEAVDGGYDPDAGGNNCRATRRDLEKLGKYLSQESKLRVTASVEPKWSTPSVEGGYDVYPKAGPYVKIRGGPVTIKVKLDRK